MTKIKMLKRALRRGVTLVEILIVLAIVGLIADGIAVYAVPKFQKAQVDTTHTNAKVLQPIADAWRASHAGECPTVQRLREEKEIAATANINDAWGHAYVIRCDETETVIVSWGPDGKEGTKDDITEPETQPASK